MKERIKRMVRRTLIVILTCFITGCEGSQVFIPRDEPEKLSSVAIIDADFAINSIIFKKSFQPEYPGEISDSLSELSFMLSSADSELFKYSRSGSFRNATPIGIPDNIRFETGKQYFFRASEKSVGPVSSQISVPSLPPDFTVDSIKKIFYDIYTGPLCKSFRNVTAAKLNISIKKTGTDISYLTLLIEGSRSSVSFNKIYITYSVLNSKIPCFIARIPAFYGTTVPLCNIGGKGGSGSDPCPVLFFTMRKGDTEGNRISITVDIRGGKAVYDYTKPVSIRLLSIPEELYNYEKSFYTYLKTMDDPFAEPVYLDSNIKDGYGIFAICRSKEITVSLPWE
jgi:hypothetical protein